MTYSQMGIICANVFVAASITRWDYLFSMAVFWAIFSVVACYVEKP